MSTSNTLNQDIDALFATAKPLTQEELQSFGEKNREIMERPSFKAGALKDQFKHAILEAMGAEGINQSEGGKRGTPRSAKTCEGKVVEVDGELNINQ